MPTSENKLRIIVGGLVGQYPLGGVAWDYFHYCLALAELGHDVYYHEDTWGWPINPALGYPEADPADTMRTCTEPFFRRFFVSYAPHLQDRWHFVLLHDKHYGMTREAFAEVARTADIYLNVSGASFLPDNLGPRCRKVFLDTDPGYNQMVMNTRASWVANVDRWIEQVRAHDVHLTYAENIWANDCRIPRMDFDWRPTRCVVTLPSWAAIRANPPAPTDPFTTVMTWKYFNGPVEHEGIHYHGKAPEYEKFHDLPQRVGVPLVLAVAGEKYDRAAIERDGWQFREANALSLTPEDYMQFIARSRGEWSVAKNVYVDTHSGWFSCRTACYLAAGRPAIVQDTAWSRYVPSGRGVIAFTTIDQAIAGLQEVADNYAAHSTAAYEIARDFLAPNKVLPSMIEAIYASPRRQPVQPGPIPPSAGT